MMNGDGVARIVSPDGAIFTKQPGALYWQRNGRGQWKRVLSLFMPVGRLDQQTRDEINAKLGNGDRMTMIHPQPRRRQ